MQPTNKQKQFCKEYIIDSNATQAAVRAGYSPKTARSQACNLLTKQNIIDYIQQLIDNKEHRAQVKAEYIREQWLALLSDCKNDAGTYTDRTNAQSVLRTMAQSCAMLTDNLNNTESAPVLPLDKDLKALLQDQAKTWEEQKRKNIKIDRTGT